MKKIIITGGVGFIGTNLCLSALHKSFEIVLIDNFSRKGAEVNLFRLQEELKQSRGSLLVHRCDIRDSDKLTSIIALHRDAVGIFHLAGQVAVTSSIKNPREDLEINCIGTFNVLEAMRLSNMQCLLVFSSTNKVYGALEKLQYEESETRYSLSEYPSGISEAYPLDLHSPYGCSKGAADQYVLDYSRIYGLNAVVLRQSCIYGVNQLGIEDQGWVAWFTIAGFFGQEVTIFGDGKQVRDVLYIDDLINLYWKLLDEPSRCSGIAYNVGGGADFQLSVRDLINVLSRKLGNELKFKTSKTREGDQKVFISNNQLISSHFDWTPQVDPESGVSFLIDWVSINQEMLKRIGILC